MLDVTIRFLESYNITIMVIYTIEHSTFDTYDIRWLYMSQTSECGGKKS